MYISGADVREKLKNADPLSDKTFGKDIAIHQLEENVSPNQTMLRKETHKLRGLMVAVLVICFIFLILYLIFPHLVG